MRLVGDRDADALGIERALRVGCFGRLVERELEARDVREVGNCVQERKLRQERGQRVADVAEVRVLGDVDARVAPGDAEEAVRPDELGAHRIDLRERVAERVEERAPVDLDAPRRTERRHRAQRRLHAAHRVRIGLRGERAGEVELELTKHAVAPGR